MTPSKLPLWLVASLIANALLIGLLIGGGLKKSTTPTPQVSPNELQIARSIHDVLPEEARRSVRRQFQQALRATQPERREIRRLRRKLRRMLLAETYDQAAVAAIFAELRAADSAMRASLHEELIQQLGELSLEQRQSVLRDLGRDRRDAARRRRAPPPSPPDE